VQGVYKTCLTNFQDTFNKVTADFHADHDQYYNYVYTDMT